MAKKVALMQGNEACAHGAVYAGCNFFGGYPITPSTEVAEVLSGELPKVGGKFIQMEDEIAAMASVIGASLAGSKALTATSGPGVSLKQELIGYACIAETPCVIINVMRGGPSTGMPTGPGQSDVMQAKWGTHGDHAAIALVPASCQEIYTETVRAFNLAEKYRMPVQVLYDEIVGHMRERVEFPEPGELEVIDREAPSVSPEDYKPYDDTKGQVPPLAAFGSEYKFHVTGLNKAADGFPTTKAESLLNIILKVLLIISVAGMVGVATTSFVAILGAAGLAVGLALQGSLANFAGGVLLLIFKPFRVGDLIITQGETGKVKEITIFNTIITTPRGNSAILPNGAVANDKIVNFSKEPTMRVDLIVGIGYSEDIPKAKAVIMAALEANDMVLSDPAPFVGVESLGDNSVNLTVRPYCKSEHYWDVYFSCYEEVKIALDKASIEIPFPQRDLHIKTGTLS